MNFLDVLNICFGGNRALSNNVMSKFFHNLSEQALSISGDSAVLKFDTMKNLNKNINDLRKTIHMPKKGAIISEIPNLNSPTIVGDELTMNKIESIVVKENLNNEKHPTDVDNDNDISDIPLAKLAENN